MFPLKYAYVCQTGYRETFEYGSWNQAVTPECVNGLQKKKNMLKHCEPFQSARTAGGSGFRIQHGHS